ncbi:MAG: ComEC/Rec2 family competence protein, partial [Marinobacter sp.]
MGARIAAFACGVIILYSGLFTPPWALAMALPGVVLMVALWCRPVRGGPVLLVPGFLLAGLGWSALIAGLQLADRLDPQLEAEPLTVSGYVCSAPAPGAWGSVRFSLCLNGDRPAGIPDRLRLAWYGDGATLKLPSPMTATVVLKRPHGAVNPAGFRYETWLFRAGYGATGSVRSVETDPAGPCPLACRYHRWRQDLVLAAGERLQTMTHKGLGLSLLLGYRGELTQRHWEVLEATGTIHLVAISGLHLGLVAAMAGLLLRWLASRLPSGGVAPRRLRQWLWLLVALAACGYALLA